MHSMQYNNLLPIASLRENLPPRPFLNLKYVMLGNMSAFMYVNTIDPFKMPTISLTSHSKAADWQQRKSLKNVLQSITQQYCILAIL